MTSTTHQNKTVAKAVQHTKDLTYVALAVGLISVCSWISIPTVVPFTLQTFAVFATLALIGGRRGTVAIVCYILLGLVGAPVFSNMTGGIGVLAGLTGGYIIGFVFIGLAYWLFETILAKERGHKSRRLSWDSPSATSLARLGLCWSMATALERYLSPPPLQCA